MVGPGTPYMLGSVVREYAYVCGERCREQPGTVHRPATVRRAWASSCKSLGHPLSLVRLFPLLRYTVYRTLVPREHQLRDRAPRMHVTAIRRDSSQPRILICRANETVVISGHESQTDMTNWIILIERRRKRKREREREISIIELRYLESYYLE